KHDLAGRARASRPCLSQIEKQETKSTEGGKMKKTDKLAALDASIEAERRTIERLQANCQRTREEARKAEEQQGRLAYRALGEGEAQAQAALSEAEDILAKGQARARSSEIALQAAQAKLESLQSER